MTVAKTIDQLHVDFQRCARILRVVLRRGEAHFQEGTLFAASGDVFVAVPADAHGGLGTWAYENVAAMARNAIRRGIEETDFPVANFARSAVPALRTRALNRNVREANPRSTLEKIAVHF